MSWEAQRGPWRLLVALVALSDVVSDQFFDPLPGEERADVRPEVHAPHHRGLVCRVGEYEDHRSGRCELCQAGRYGARNGLKHPLCSAPCPKGHYCPAGTAFPVSTKCPAGRYGSMPGMAIKDCTGPCMPGYFCPLGSTSATEAQCSNTTFFCPPGSGAQISVTVGYYTTGATAQTRSGQALCERGHYCVAGIRYPCPAGTFGRTTGLHTANCTGPCPPGHYCPPGSVFPTTCPAGTFGGPVYEQQIIRSHGIGTYTFKLDLYMPSVVSTIQAVTLRSDDTLASGTWKLRLTLTGSVIVRYTPPLQWDASADAVKEAVNGLGNIALADVTRSSQADDLTTNGYTWSITMITNRDMAQITGEPDLLVPVWEGGDKLEDCSAADTVLRAHDNSPSTSTANGADMSCAPFVKADGNPATQVSFAVEEVHAPFSTWDSEEQNSFLQPPGGSAKQPNGRSRTRPHRPHPRVVTASGGGWEWEQYWQASGGLHSHTAFFGDNTTAARMEDQINTKLGLGAVQVSRSESPGGYSWTVTFIKQVGDVPLLTPVLGPAGGSVTVEEVVKGAVTHFSGDPALVTHHRLVRESNRRVWVRAGLSTAACTGLCHLGHYCPPGSFHPQQARCPAGRYGAVRGLASDACAADPANDCDLGEGASTVPASANAGGRYAAGAGAGGTTSAETYVHEYPQAGVYGTAARESVPGTQSDTASTGAPRIGHCKPSVCPAGYYCPAGTRSPHENPCGSARHEEVYVHTHSLPDDWLIHTAVDPHPAASDEHHLHYTEGGSAHYGDARRARREDQWAGANAVDGARGAGGRAPQRDWEGESAGPPAQNGTQGTESGAHVGRYIYTGGDFDTSTTMYPYNEHGGIASGRVISPRSPSHPSRLGGAASRRRKMAPELQLLYGWAARYYCPEGSALPSVVAGGHYTTAEEEVYTFDGMLAKASRATGGGAGRRGRYDYDTYVDVQTVLGPSDAAKTASPQGRVPTRLHLFTDHEHQGGDRKGWAENNDQGGEQTYLNHRMTPGGPFPHQSGANARDGDRTSDVHVGSSAGLGVANNEPYTHVTSGDRSAYKDTDANVVGGWRDRHTSTNVLGEKTTTIGGGGGGGGGRVGPSPPMTRRFRYLSDSDGEGILYFLGSRPGAIHERSRPDAALPGHWSPPSANGEDATSVGAETTGLGMYGPRPDPNQAGYAAKNDPWRHPAWVPEGVKLTWSAPGSPALTHAMDGNGPGPEALLSNAHDYYHVGHRSSLNGQYPQSAGGLPSSSHVGDEVMYGVVAAANASTWFAGWGNTQHESGEWSHKAADDGSAAWWQLDLGPARFVQPDYYSLRSGCGRGEIDAGKAPRSWRLEASVHGHRWVVLRDHPDDERTFQFAPYATGSWELPPTRRYHQDYASSHGGETSDGHGWRVDDTVDGPFRFFRIVMTGPTNDGGTELYLSGFELYGELLQLAPMLARLPPANTRAGQAECEPGHYCVDGVKTRCAPGLYGDSAALSSPACSGVCPPGYYCPAGTVGRHTNPCGERDMYCPEGSAAPITVELGYYSVGGTAMTRSGQKQCPPGSFCVRGVLRRCPPGRFGDVAGLSSSRCSGLCASGHYCPRGTVSRVQHACPAGRYSLAGASKPQCTGECQAGYFCPTGSVSPTQRECGGEDVYCPTGSGAPIPIPTGYYSTGGDVRTRSGKSECREQDSAYLPQCPSTTIKSS